MELCLPCAFIVCRGTVVLFPSNVNRTCSGTLVMHQGRQSMRVFSTRSVLGAFHFVQLLGGV